MNIVRRVYFVLCLFSLSAQADLLDTWTIRTSGTSNSLQDITYGNGKFVAVGSGGTILTSPDAITWKSSVSGVSTDLSGVAYGKGLFVAVGSNSTSLLTSPDGITWTLRENILTKPVTFIKYVNDKFFAIGGNYFASYVFTSIDGLIFNETTGSQGHSAAVAYGDGKWVVSGYAANISTSTDAINWSTVANLPGGWIFCLIYANNQFVAIDNIFYWGGTPVYTSPDGINWTQKASLDATYAPLSIAYANGQYVAVGAISNGNALILSSLDAITWQQRNSSTSSSLRNIVFADGRFVVVGNNGTILTSECVTACGSNTPDFVINSISLTPISPVANTPFTAKVAVKNQGTTSGNGGNLVIWSDQNSVQACKATGDKSVAVGTLAAGASKTLTLTGLKVASAGIKTFRAFVDANCATAESDENNNQLTASYRVKANAPDFLATSVTLNPAVPSANSSFTATVTVSNQGTTAADAGYLDVWANTRSTVEACGDEGDAWVDIGILEAGTTKSFQVTLPAGVAGAKTLRTFIDSWCETLESNEINNQFTTGYKVK